MLCVLTTDEQKTHLLLSVLMPWLFCCGFMYNANMFVGVLVWYSFGTHLNPLVFLVISARRCFLCESTFVIYVPCLSLLCHLVGSLQPCGPRADLLAILCMMFSCGLSLSHQVWYLITSISYRCLLLYLYNVIRNAISSCIFISLRKREISERFTLKVFLYHVAVSVLHPFLEVS